MLVRDNNYILSESRQSGKPLEVRNHPPDRRNCSSERTLMRSQFFSKHCAISSAFWTVREASCMLCYYYVQQAHVHVHIPQCQDNDVQVILACETKTPKRHRSPKHKAGHKRPHPVRFLPPLLTKDINTLSLYRASVAQTKHTTQSNSPRGASSAHPHLRHWSKHGHRTR